MKDPESTPSPHPGQGAVYPPNTSIHIIGASVFGLSSAFHLTQAGYHNITVFDRSPTLPGPYAASHDLNKIIRAEYSHNAAKSNDNGNDSDDFYTDLALQAMEAWSSPEWTTCFRKTGYVRLARTAEGREGIERDVAHFSASAVAGESREGRRRRWWFPAKAFQALRSKEEVTRAVPVVDAALVQEEGWSGVVNWHAGYALASKAVSLLHRRCVVAGVKFVLGAQGHIVSLERGSKRRVTGLRGSDGSVHRHPAGVPCLTILAIGAELPRLLPEAATQMTAKAWSVAHLALTPQEAAQLEGAPVVSLGGLGFWIEPVFVPETSAATGGRHLLKFAAHGGGWTNSTQHHSSSPEQHTSTAELPHALPPLTRLNVIPASDERQIRDLIRLTLPPHFLTKPLIQKSLCWCADTASSDFLIDFVPGATDLLVAGADSGHAFKFLPTAGAWVLDVVQRGLQREERWQWKAGGNRSDVGARVAWRGGKVRELAGQAML